MPAKNKTQAMQFIAVAIPKKNSRIHGLIKGKKYLIKETEPDDDYCNCDSCREAEPEEGEDLYLDRECDACDSDEEGCGSFSRTNFVFSRALKKCRHVTFPNCLCRGRRYL